MFGCIHDECYEKNIFWQLIWSPKENRLSTLSMQSRIQGMLRQISLIHIAWISNVINYQMNHFYYYIASKTLCEGHWNINWFYSLNLSYRYHMCNVAKYVWRLNLFSIKVSYSLCLLANFVFRVRLNCWRIIMLHLRGLLSYSSSWKAFANILFENNINT